MPCRHCHQKKVNRPLGLCWSCYYTPGVREQYGGAVRTLSDQWRDVTCPTCRSRLTEADHPNQRYAVRGFANTHDGHAVFWDFDDEAARLCNAGPRKQTA